MNEDTPEPNAMAQEGLPIVIDMMDLELCLGYDKEFFYSESEEEEFYYSPPISEFCRTKELIGKGCIIYYLVKV